MELSALEQMFVWAFGLAFILGAVATWSNFCTMGSVSDLVNMGDKTRLGSWFLAIATAIAGVALLQYFDIVDMSLTTSNDTSNPPYRTPNFVWLRYILGGLIFGFGMTLGSGCGNKTLIRIGGGNIKSLFTFAAIMAGAALMMFTNFSYDAFLSWMTPLGINFADHDIAGQDLGSLFAALSGSDSSLVPAIVAAVIVIALLYWVFKVSGLKKDFPLLTAGFVIGAVIVAAWWVTAGSLGQTILEEADFMDERPYALGAQSFTFIAPTAHTYQYLSGDFNPSLLTFGIFAMLGVIAGSLIYSVVSGNFRIEWFSSKMDFVNHIVGGFAMGIGGVLAMGCSIGQGITGSSTLALGSFIALASIILGSAWTMKYQYYRMLYEEDSRLAAFITAMVELRLLPKSMRKLEAL